MRPSLSHAIDLLAVQSDGRANATAACSDIHSINYFMNLSADQLERKLFYLDNQPVRQSASQSASKSAIP